MTSCCVVAENRSYYTDHSPNCHNHPTVSGVYVTRNGQPLARGYLMEGYAAGSADDGEWLCVWGSAYHSELVFATAEAADVRAELLRSPAHASIRDSVVVRRVTCAGHHVQNHRLTCFTKPGALSWGLGSTLCGAMSQHPRVSFRGAWHRMPPPRPRSLQRRLPPMMSQAQRTNVRRPVIPTGHDVVHLIRRPHTPLPSLDPRAPEPVPGLDQRAHREELSRELR